MNRRTFMLGTAGVGALMAGVGALLRPSDRGSPEANLLLGKPLPVRSVELFYQTHKGTFDPSRQLQWLLDTPRRLMDYLSYRIHEQERLSSEVSVGTAFLKPTCHRWPSMCRRPLSQRRC
ncbi:hypothetical protein SAMN03159391_00732 [Pseudomonas sp. NFACC37-1]|nr:hypothetical protein SAMN03159391_00732 [Pseudomonas sp. NFACC37-1]